MCSDCHRTEAKDYWQSLVQIRQRCDNKKTFFYLEQLILKHKAHENTLGIKPVHGKLQVTICSILWINFMFLFLYYRGLRFFLLNRSSR